MNSPTSSTLTSKKCCFCIPLRSGLMAAGCLNSIIDIALLFLLCHHILQLYYMYSSHWFPLLETIISAVTAMLYANDLIFNMIFLYGCYKKDFVKLRVFIRYNVVYVILNMFMISYFLLELFFSRDKWGIRRLVILIVIGSWTIYNLFTIYLTSRLIRIEEKKIENNMQSETCANDALALTTIKEDVEPITIIDENVDIY